MYQMTDTEVTEWGVRTHHEELAAVIVRQRAEQRTREVLAKVMTPEALDALACLLGVDGVRFSFQKGRDGAFDTLDAMRVDTLRGVVETLRFETTKERIDTCQSNLERMEVLMMQQHDD